MPTPSEILDAEIGLLGELIELARAISEMEPPALPAVEAAVAKRTALIAELDRLEGEASRLGLRPIAADSPLTEKVQRLVQLAGQVEAAERDASSKLDLALSLLRGEAATLAKGQEGLRGYGGPVSHLSRFTDRKG